MGRGEGRERLALANSDAGKNGEEVIAREVSLGDAMRMYRGRAMYVQRLAYEYELRIALADASTCFSSLYGALWNKSPHRTWRCSSVQLRANFRAAVFTLQFRDRPSQFSETPFAPRAEAIVPEVVWTSEWKSKK